MKTISLKSTLLVIISAFIFFSCENNDIDVSTELSIEEKLKILEKGEWLPKDFEDRIMYIFKSGEQFTYYGQNSVFDSNPIPGTFTYTIQGNLISIDYNFGNIKTYEIKLFCNNEIIKLYENGILANTLYKRNSKYKECL